MVAEDRPFLKSQVPVIEAMELFRARGEDDKVRLLAHRQKETLVLYRMNGHSDYLQGYMVPSTGYLRLFDAARLPAGVPAPIPAPWTTPTT